MATGAIGRAFMAPSFRAYIAEQSVPIVRKKFLLKKQEVERTTGFPAPAK